MEHVEHYTVDWFSQNIGNWKRWLAEFPGQPLLRCLEIGSFEGRSTVWLLRNVLTGNHCTIDCHDLFEDHYYPRFLANVEAWKDRVTTHRGRSEKTLHNLEGSYDIAYIDGNHDPYEVLSDAVMVWRFMRVGSVIIFDDYLWLPSKLTPPAEGWSIEVQMEQIARHPAHATKTGIDAFLQVVVGQYEVIDRGYQLAIRKTGRAP